MKLMNKLFEEAGDDGAADGGAADTGDNGDAAAAAASTSDNSSDATSTDNNGADGGDNGDNNSIAVDYEAIQLPEGVSLNEKQLEHFKPLFDKTGLGQEQVQELITAQADYIQEMEKANNEAFEAEVQQWETDIKNDSVLGGDQLEETQRLFKTAIDAVESHKDAGDYNGQSLSELLDTYGLSKHPLIVQAFTILGRDIQEDRNQGGGSGSGGSVEKTDAEKMYPNDV